VPASETKIETAPGDQRDSPSSDVSQIKRETFEKCSILVKVKEGENFNHRNILNISRIEI